MATIGAALTSAKNSSRLSYISAATFNTVFLTYTTSTTNYVTTGTLAANVLNPTTGVTVTSGDCPAGRVLRETGRKLFPDANPGVTTCLVSVYDRITGATGFIDPNSPYFAIYNVDKANFLLQDSDEQVALGPPVYTGGTVTATGNITSTTGDVSAGSNLVATGGLVISRVGTTAGAPFSGKATLVGGSVAVATSVVTANSLIFLSYNDGAGFANSGVLNVSARTANTSFTISSTNSSDGNEVAWLIVN